MRLYTDCIPCQMALDCPTGIQVVTTPDPTAAMRPSVVLQKYPNSFRYNGKGPHSAVRSLWRIRGSGNKLNFQIAL